MDIKFSEIMHLAQEMFLPKRTYVNNLSVTTKKFKRIHGSKYCIMLSSARSALYLILNNLNLKKDDEIILSSLNFFAIPKLIEAMGFVPKFVDIKKNSYNMSAKSIIQNINTKTKVIILTHYYGEPMYDAKLINNLKRKKIVIIEDCAEALGAKVKDNYVGNFGDASIFSFGYTKNIAIKGGALLTNNKRLFTSINRQISIKSKNYYQQFKHLSKILFVFTFSLAPIYNFISIHIINLIRNLSIDPSDVFREKSLNINLEKLHDEISYLNYPLTFLNILNRVMINNNKRINNYQKFYKKIKNKKISFFAPNKNQVYLSFPIFSENKSALSKYLLNNGIYVPDGFLPTDLSYLNDLSQYPKSEYVNKHIIHIPNYPSMKKQYINQLIDILNKY